MHKNRVKDIKKNTGKKRNNRQALYQPTDKRKAKEGEQQSAKMTNQHSANQRKKNTMKTAALVAFTKTLQTRKKRREKSKRQEKIILNGK